MMTVSQLIASLQKFDGNLPVLVSVPIEFGDADGIYGLPLGEGTNLCTADLEHGKWTDDPRGTSDVVQLVGIACHGSQRTF